MKECPSGFRPCIRCHSGKENFHGPDHSRAREFRPPKADRTMTVRWPGDLEIRPSPIDCFGVFACRDFEPGDDLGELAGEIVREDALSVLWLDDSWGISLRAPYCYLNHGRPANVVIGDDLILRATARIAAGDELLMDYGPEWEN